MAEQASAAEQITTASESMRKQSDQVAKATAERSRAVNDMNSAGKDVSKQIGLVSRANRDHVAGSGRVLEALAEIRSITERNAQGVKQTLRGTDNLAKLAQTFNAIVENVAVNGGTSR